VKAIDNTPQAHNRRTTDRLPILLPIEFRGPDGHKEGRTLNVSRTGMFIETESPLQPGLRAFFRLRPEEPKLFKFNLEAEVVWSRYKGHAGKKIPKGMGVRFLSGPTQSAQTLDGIFSMLNRLQS